MTLSPAALGIILNETRTHVLLVKRKDVPIWVLPGGGIEKGEEPAAAAVREIYEETGYHVAIERQSGEYTPINKLASLSFVYLCRIESGESALTPETAAIHFFSLKDLPATFFLLHRDWVNDAIDYTNVVKKKITQVTYWAVFKYFLTHPIFLINYLKTRFLTGTN